MEVQEHYKDENGDNDQAGNIILREPRKWAQDAKEL